ncbi:MAG: transposase [bacterium]
MFFETFNYQRAEGGRCLSGKSVRGKPRISKRENDLIRALLYQGTLSAVRYNPQVRGIYQRLKEKGAPEKKIRIAAAHKLLLFAHAIYKKGCLATLPTQEGLT